MFDIKTTDATPIWKQIDEGIRRMIALVTLRPGDAVPSVRDLARDLRVNPNTVARAYQYLAERGVLAVRRGEGTFVAESPSQPKKAERSEKLRDAAVRYVSTAIALGATPETAVAEVEQSFDRFVREERRRQ
jgi:GntR family transcriptional regulator